MVTSVTSTTGDFSSKSGFHASKSGQNRYRVAFLTHSYCCKNVSRKKLVQESALFRAKNASLASYGQKIEF